MKRHFEHGVSPAGVVRVHLARLRRCNPFGIHPMIKMATKSVRDFTHRIRCGQGSNLLIPCTPHQHSPLHLRADKKSSRHCSFPSECSHDSIRPWLVSSFEFFVSSVNSKLATRNPELVYNANDSITPIQWSAFSSPRANSEIT